MIASIQRTAKKLRASKENSIANRAKLVRQSWDDEETARRATLGAAQRNRFVLMIVDTERVLPINSIAG